MSREFSHLCFRAIEIGPPHLCWQSMHACGPHWPGGVQEKGLLCRCTCPLEHDSPLVRLAPSLPTFHKNLRIWLCQLAWGTNGGTSQWNQLTSQWDQLTTNPSSPPAPLLPIFNWVCLCINLFMFLIYTIFIFYDCKLSRVTLR